MQKLEKCFLVLFLIFGIFGGFGLGAVSEHERVAEFYRRGHQWPPKWQPETEAFRKRMDAWEAEILSMNNVQKKWDAWMQHVQVRLTPNFTENGFKLVRAPEHIWKVLDDNLQTHLQENKFRNEETYRIPEIHGESRPDFIDQNQLNKQILYEMLPLHEEWCGKKLIPSISYGVRLYRNGSVLDMHVDKLETHVISSILHINRKYHNDDEPWPIEIEGFDGKHYAIDLKPGDLLFYESSKAMHGRPTSFKGEYYSSIFTHYYPVDWSLTTKDKIYAVPPHWNSKSSAEFTRSQDYASLVSPHYTEL